MKKKQAKSLVNKTIDLALDILAFIVALTIDALTWVARKVWKRYFGIETPLYKLWHKNHARHIQKLIWINHPEWHTQAV
ncbi:MAG TPA: hypothetical protein DEG90_05050 [Porphyromonadaceae bacterium]|nr:hypothetical protein [Porphyromonadaceae bacterium]